MTANGLLVEGNDDKRVLPELLERAGVAWGPRGQEVVRIHAVDGFGNLTRDEIESQLKEASLERLAILVDADDDPPARWASLCDRVRPWLGDLPAAPPPEGLVVEVPPRSVRISPRLRRFGVWMMPDNQVRGMLETFLLALRPGPNPAMFAHVERATDEASQIGGDGVFKAPHRDKALVHTWLAWHGDPPGRQLHDAIKERTLDPTLPFAAPFVAWFRRAFELP